MIEQVEISNSKLTLGQSTILTVKAASPISISIECFIDKPPPPHFGECSECAVYIVDSGEPLTLRADPESWLSLKGGYRLCIRDADGDEKNELITVLSDEKLSEGEMESES